jgi:hypothetical protein
MRVASSSLSFSFSWLGLGLLALACGGKPAVPPGAGGAASAASAGAGAATASRPPAELGPLPPMAAMPAAGVSGSKKARRKDDAALASCAGPMPRARDPEALVRRIGEACAKVPAGAKLKPVGAPLRGQQADGAPHAEQTLEVAAGKCYRVYFATDEGARDVVVVARDSSGDVIAESPGPALPEGGVMCFTAADKISLLVAVGSGKAAWVAQAWVD